MRSPDGGDANKATPRDYLANERTFLAYVRTALSFIAFGFVVARFALFAREVIAIEHVSPKALATVSTTLGVAMTIVGIVIGIYGALRYDEQDRALRQGVDGTMPVRGAVAMTAAVVVFGIIIAFDLIRIH